MNKTPVFILPLTIMLAACSPKTTLAPVTLTDSQHKLYQQSCQNCHNNPASPAPQAGDKQAWQQRLDKGGMALLVQHALQGFNAMPAGGMCTICTPADLEAMIGFMATTTATAK